MNEKFYPELTRRLRQAGVAVGTETDNRLPVLVNGQEAMAVTRRGTILIEAGMVNSPVADQIYDQVTEISGQVCEYITAMDSAPALEADGLHKGFRLLAEFNGVVLAGKELEQGWGYQFVTWRRSPDRTSVAHGSYHLNDYAGAKQDFACRAGLVQEYRQFTDEQLTEIYRCVHETLDSDYPITRQREGLLQAVSEQIERGVENLEKLVSQSNERELAEMGQAVDSGPDWGMSP